MTSRTSRRPRRGALATASAFRPLTPSRGRYGALPVSALSRTRSQYWTEPVPVVLPVDRRVYSPIPSISRPAERFSGRPARVVAPRVAKRATAPSRLSQRTWSALLFSQPSNVAVCFQRGRRREVLHALGVAGGQVRPGRRGPYSGVSCSAN